MSQKNYTGYCERFNLDKGFGFIHCDDGSGDIFVHQSEIFADTTPATLRKGERLEFQILSHDQGNSRKAINVTGPHGAYVKGVKSSNNYSSNQNDSNQINNNNDPSSIQQEKKWFYKDPSDQEQGPFSKSQMSQWFFNGYFPQTLPIRNNRQLPFIELTNWFSQGLSGKDLLIIFYQFLQTEIKRAFFL